MKLSEKLAKQINFIENMRKNGCDNCKELVEIIDERIVWLQSGKAYADKQKKKIKILNNEVLELEMRLKKVDMPNY